MSMFKTQKEDEPMVRANPSSNDHTLIGHSVKVEGNFMSNDNVTVEGSLNGSLKTDKHLHVGEKAQIVAEVHAASAVIAGSVNGNIKVSGALTLKSSANVEGDITSKKLIVEEGATFNGQCHMKDNSGSPAPAQKNGEKKDEKK